MSELDMPGNHRSGFEHTVLTHPENIQRPHHIAGRGITAISAIIRSATLLSLSAYGTRLRRISFRHFNRAAGLVVQLVDDLSVTGTRNLLRPYSSDLLCRLVKWLTNIDQRAGKCIAHYIGCLVGDVFDAIAALVQQLIFASLQTLMATRTALMMRLFRLQRGQLLIAPLDSRFGLTSTDDNGLFAVCDRDEAVDSQITANRDVFGLWHIGNFTRYQQSSVEQTHFHHPSGKLNVGGNTNRETTTFAIGQNQQPSDLIFDQTGSLIGINNIAIMKQLPRIARFMMTILAKLASGIDRFQKLTDDLLNALGVQVGIASCAPLFPTLFSGPFPIEATDTEVADDQIIPQPRRFLPGLGIGLPLGLASWKPVEFNRSVCHTRNYTVQYTTAQLWLKPGMLSPTATQVGWLSRGLKP